MIITPEKFGAKTRKNRLSFRVFILQFHIPPIIWNFFSEFALEFFSKQIVSFKTFFPDYYAFNAAEMSNNEHFWTQKQKGRPNSCRGREGHFRPAQFARFGCAVGPSGAQQPQLWRGAGAGDCPRKSGLHCTAWWVLNWSIFKDYFFNCKKTLTFPQKFHIPISEW